MIGRAVASIALLFALSGPAVAEPPERSPRPENRAGPPAEAARSPRPPERPGTLREGAAARAGPVALCGDPAIRGTRIAPIPGRIKGCGIAQPIRLTSVSGVTLSQPATVDCATATALREWVDTGVTPEIGEFGGGVEALRVVAHYSCRPRNRQPGAKISEHGRGRAIDIAAIRLANGEELNVLDDWSDPETGPMMKRLHEAACGPFGTVLGPDSDRFHQDHFHFDTARYRLGSYCR